MKVSENVYKYRRFRNKYLVADFKYLVFEKCLGICAYLGVWGRRGTHFRIRGVGSAVGRLPGRTTPVWVIILLPDHKGETD